MLEDLTSSNVIAYLEHERLNTKIGMKVRKELNERKFE
jgi:hypothetical protein